MGVARAFSTLTEARSPSKSDREFLVARGAGNLAFSWSAFHPEIAMTPRAFDLDPWHVRLECEV